MQYVAQYPVYRLKRRVVVKKFCADCGCACKGVVPSEACLVVNLLEPAAEGNQVHEPDFDHTWRQTDDHREKSSGRCKTRDTIMVSFSTGRCEKTMNLPGKTTEGEGSRNLDTVLSIQLKKVILLVCLLILFSRNFHFCCSVVREVKVLALTSDLFINHFYDLAKSCPGQNEERSARQKD